MKKIVVGLAVAFLFLTQSQGAIAQPANAPAPMFGLNLGNTNASPYVGVSTNPQILWQIPHAQVSIDAPALVLDSRGILYSPDNSPVWAATGQTVSFLTMPFGRSGTPAIDAAGNIYHWEGEGNACVLCERFSALDRFADEQLRWTQSQDWA